MCTTIGYNINLARKNSTKVYTPWKSSKHNIQLVNRAANLEEFVEGVANPANDGYN